MKRKIVSIVIALFAFLPVLAEGYWGAKASFDINAPGRWRSGDMSVKMYRSGVGASLGGVYTHFITDGFFLEPSLTLFYDTYRCHDLTVSGDSGETYDPGVYKVGLRFPVVIGYTFDITDGFALSVFTGPELDYAFAGGYRYKDKAFDGSMGPLFGGNGAHRRFSASWKGGFGFPFSDWRIDLEAAFGMTDIISGIPSCKENRISISLLRYF